MQMMKQSKEYYPWICPVCKNDSCCDPMRIVGTVCHNGHHVILDDFVGKNGIRGAIENKELNKLIHGEEIMAELKGDVL